MKIAEQRICVCTDDEHVVHIDCIKLVDSEFPDGVDGYYCTECNSFWREP